MLMFIVMLEEEDAEVAVAAGGGESVIEKGQTNREEVGTSGSRRKPDTHIRANASSLSDKIKYKQKERKYRWKGGSTYVKKTKSTKSA